MSERSERVVAASEASHNSPSGGPRKLIVNADDFGLTAGVNRAIVESHERGVLTSTTVLANGVAAAEAGELPSRCPELSVGVHVNVTLGAPLSDPASVPSIVDGEGRFLGEGTLLKRIVRRQIRAEDVHREVAAQIAAVRALGVEPTHWDGHRAVVFWPGLLGPAAAAAYESGLRRVRSPRVWVVDPGRNAWAARMRWRLRPRRLLTEANRLAGIRRLRAQFAMPSWRTSANLVEHVDGYLDRWRAAFAYVPPGITEMVIHPAHVDAELRALTPGLVDKRLDDLAVLLDPRTRRVLDETGVELISFRDL